MAHVAKLTAAARASGELGPGELSGRLLNLGPSMVNDHFLRRGVVPDLATLADMVDNAWQPLLMAAAALDHD